MTDCQSQTRPRANNEKEMVCPDRAFVEKTILDGAVVEDNKKVLREVGMHREAIPRQVSLDVNRSDLKGSYFRPRPPDADNKCPL